VFQILVNRLPTVKLNVQSIDTVRIVLYYRYMSPGPPPA
jgi:hypothetical protein